MWDEEHQFESKADAGASKTHPQQAGTIRKNGYIVIPCKVVEVSNFQDWQARTCQSDIFTAKKLEDIVPSSHNCDIKDEFAEGKDLVVSVMGEGGADLCTQGYWSKVNSLRAVAHQDCGSTCSRYLLS